LIGVTGREGERGRKGYRRHAARSLLLLLLLSAQFGGSCPRAQQSRGRRTASPKYFIFNQLEKVSVIVSLTGLILFGLVGAKNQITLDHFSSYGHEL